MNDRFIMLDIQITDSVVEPPQLVDVIKKREKGTYYCTTDPEERPLMSLKVRISSTLQFHGNFTLYITEAGHLNSEALAMAILTGKIKIETL